MPMTIARAVVSTTASCTSARDSLRGTRRVPSVPSRIFAVTRPTRNLAVRVTAGGFVRYGVREDPSPGDTSVGFLETYGLDLGGGAIQRETLKFGVGSQAVALQIARPLGIVFEDVGGACVAVEVVPDSNAADAGVLPGDVLRMCSAVAKGKSTVTVGKFAVEPSLGMRKQSANRAACFCADGVPFPNCMDAIVSNGEEIDGVASATASLLLERPASEKS